MIKRITLFSCPMDAASMDDTVDWIADRTNRRQFTQHVVVNVAKLVNMRSDASLSESVRSCDLINIDGMGVVWAARLLGHVVPERVAGVDLFERLVAMSAERSFPVFFLGGTEEVVARVCAKLKAQFPALKVAGYHHGYFWDDEQKMVESIRESGARLLFVAISSPKKETFIERWKEQLGVDFVMGVGGTFDVIAGKVRRAPKWMQMAGMEWLFRVIQEPRRMWRRYLITNSKFVLMLIKARIAATLGSTV
ncbi:WecB/TagA/CpsF family glycosyltransferase [Paraburkholderia sp. J10-1]|uniref:WecB/TagA/CpsF family glycosyltransferase n=1 Tax=Paraburkholderia sp. J10-1 TaxID=2805430 RepID=UPI002AB78932|nr:WecB/TagA/CpsF family glycosyltransferase [Paraburkholderia sp. J10-1]